MRFSGTLLVCVALTCALAALGRPEPALASGAVVIAPAAVGVQALPAAGPPCLPNAAFCETFDAAAGSGTRAGDLAPVWGVSRQSGNTNGFGGQLNGWVPTTLDLCGVLTPAQPPTDVRICNGRMVEATSDGGAVTVLAAYPKQPFDFAGRIGKIVFDVSDDTQGTHGAWPELWITDKPIPAPFTHFGSWFAGGRNALGIRFGLECNNASGTGVSSMVVVRNYVTDDSDFAGSLAVTSDGCVQKASGPNGPLNHFEVDVSQNRIDVYGTDAGGTTLVHLATAPNPNLTFTRGLIWIEDAHYNAVKAREPGETGAHKTHTFAWDNVGFDGPATYRDISTDALDSLTPGPPAQDGHATVNLGWKGTDTTPVSVTTLPIPAAGPATGANLLFSLTHYDAPLTFHYSVNGHAYTAPWPFAENTAFINRAVFLPVNLSDLVVGPNAVTISTGTLIVVSNVDIVLVAAAAVPGATPTAPPAPTATPAPTSAPTSSPAPTATPAPVQSPSPTPAPSAAPTSTAMATATPMPPASPTPTPQGAPSATPNGQPTTPPPGGSGGSTATPPPAGTSVPFFVAPIGPTGAAPATATLKPSGTPSTHATPSAVPAAAAIPPGEVQAGFHSSWLSQSDDVSLAPGKTTRLTVRFRNVGSATWVRGVLGQQANLGVTGDSALLGAGWPRPDRVAIQTEDLVPPGAVGTFAFEIRAPAAPGAYRLDVRPVIDGTTWMEDQGVYFMINSALATDSAASVSTLVTLLSVSSLLFAAFALALFIILLLLLLLLARTLPRMRRQQVPQYSMRS